MNVDELYGLALWVDREVAKARLHKKFGALATILEQNAQPNNQKQPFEDPRQDLVRTLGQMKLEQLSGDQLELLNASGADGILGQKAADSVEHILTSSGLDIASAANQVKGLANRSAQLINKYGTLAQSLAEFVRSPDAPTDEVILRVSFRGRSNIGNVVQLKKWAGEWHDIGRGVALATGHTPDDFKVVGAKKGSIILDFSTPQSLALSVSGIILASLKAAEKIQDIRLKAQQVRALKLQNDQIAKQLEEEARQQKEIMASSIADEAIAKQISNESGNGESVTALKLSIKKLLGFLERDGRVDFILPQPPIAVGGTASGKAGFDSERFAAMRNEVASIRIAEQSLRALNAPDDPVEPA